MIFQTEIKVMNDAEYKGKVVAFGNTDTGSVAIDLGPGSYIELNRGQLKEFLIRTEPLRNYQAEQPLGTQNSPLF